MYLYELSSNGKTCLTMYLYELSSNGKTCLTLYLYELSSNGKTSLTMYLYELSGNSKTVNVYKQNILMMRQRSPFILRLSDIGMSGISFKI